MAADTLIINDIQIQRLFEAGVPKVDIDTDKGIDTFITLNHTNIKVNEAEVGIPKAIIERHIDTLISSFTNEVSNSITSRTLIGENKVALALKSVLAIVKDNVNLLMALIRLRTMSEYTYIHTVNVTTICIALGAHLKIGMQDIIRFGCGAIIADLGMTNFPSNMIRRPSGLTRQEKEVLKRHPIYSVEFMQKAGILDPIVEKAVLQHHERFDGTGYPHGLRGEEIGPLSSLFAIADVYDAMISPRPHRQGCPAHMALSEILRYSGTLYDPEMAELFIHKMGVFPVGTMVELTSGRFAIVVSPNRIDPLRPVVMLFETKKKLNISDTISYQEEDNFIFKINSNDLVDLFSKEGDVFGKIRRGIDYRKLRIKPSFYLKNL